MASEGDTVRKREWPKGKADVDGWMGGSGGEGIGWGGGLKKG